MRMVIDSNRVLAAMIKESTTREILFDAFFELIAPDFILAEVRKYEDRVIKAADITKNDFEVLLALIFEHITTIPEAEYYESMKSLNEEISDPKDVPYIAACLASRAEGIWTHDPHLKEQQKVKVFTNIDLLRMSGKADSS